MDQVSKSIDALKQEPELVRMENEDGAGRKRRWSAVVRINGRLENLYRKGKVWVFDEKYPKPSLSSFEKEKLCALLDRKLAPFLLGTTAQSQKVSRASYRAGIAWIAVNDDPFGTEAKNADHVAYQISSLLLADLFGVSPERVGMDVVKYRLKRE